MITSDQLVSPQAKLSIKIPVWVVVAAVGVLAVCSAVCLAAVVFGLGKVAVEKPLVEAVLDSFMKSMAAEDVKSAYTQFSPRAQGQFPIIQLEELIEGNNYVLFEGYRSLTVQEINISITANSDPNLPQGTVATVTGIVFYDDRFQGTFDGTLEKVDGQWRIHRFDIVVPPDKLQP